jgi:hypothetical protein
VTRFNSVPPCRDSQILFFMTNIVIYEPCISRLYDECLYELTHLLFNCFSRWHQAYSVSYSTFYRISIGYLRALKSRILRTFTRSCTSTYSTLTICTCYGIQFKQGHDCPHSPICSAICSTTIEQSLRTTLVTGFR